MISPHFTNKSHIFIVILYSIHYATSVSAPPTPTTEFRFCNIIFGSTPGGPEGAGEKMAGREGEKGWRGPAGRALPGPARHGDAGASLSSSGTWHTGGGILLPSVQQEAVP